MRFLNLYNWKVVNLHPALPGMFPGTHGIEEAHAVCRRGEIEHTGVMVHLVPIHSGDSLQDLETRIHVVEHRLLVEALRGVVTRDRAPG